MWFTVTKMAGGMSSKGVGPSAPDFEHGSLVSVKACQVMSSQRRCLSNACLLTCLIRTA